MDARIRYTKMRVREALIHLLNQKPVKEISVKEVCELAEINRATFYKHYMDIFDLLDKLKKEQMSAVFEDEATEEPAPSPEGTMDSDANTPDARSTVLVQCLTRISLFGAMIKTLGGQNGDPLFYKQISEKVIQSILNNQQLSIENYEERDVRVLRNICCSGVAVIICDWVENGTKELPESIADEIQRFIKTMRIEYAPETFETESETSGEIDADPETDVALQDEIKGNTGLFGWIRKALLVE